MAYATETVEITRERVAGIEEQIIAEVQRLLKSGGIDPENHSRGLLIGVAIENIADKYLDGERKTKAYRNLKCF